MKFRLGVDYYPEHWEKNRWVVDAAMMRDAGIQFVRMAEFAWSWLEEREGRFNFSWLDDAIDLLNNTGIKTILGTPTAAPPAWLIQKHRHILPVDENGCAYEFGARRHYCISNPTFHIYTKKIVTAMAKHYGKDNRVIGWQIDNEMGAPKCYCDRCKNAFQKWVKEKYQTIKHLNDEWGNAFWSQSYRHFNQIPLPKKSGGAAQPGFMLDYHRFFSFQNVTYLNFQAEILKKHIRPDQFITTNLWGNIDHYEMVKKLDFASWDNYPGVVWSNTLGSRAIIPSDTSFQHAAVRGYKRRNFWVLEQRSGQPGATRLLAPEARPGEIRLWTYQAIAQGADGISYFRWRTCRFGMEQFWHGILNHDGLPNRRYNEVRQIGKELDRIGREIAGQPVQSRVALIFSRELYWAFTIQPHHEKFDYGFLAMDLYRAFRQQGIMVDVLPRVEELDNYQIVIAPFLYLVSPEIVRILERFVSRGGSLLLTFRSGVKNLNNMVTEKQLPGDLAELAGIVVREYDVLFKKDNGIRAPSFAKKTYPAYAWFDICEMRGAKPLAFYTREYYKGTPCLSVNSYGKGRVYYMGTMSDDSFYCSLAGLMCGKTGVKPILATPENVEVAQRGDLLFLLNHSDQTKTLNIPGKYKNLLDQNTISRCLKLKPKDAAILKPAGC